MPRNPQGLYTLPAGNPVVPNTLIESVWANTTMDDISTALTNSLPRDGSAPMVGPLTLQAAPPTQPRHAVSKGYLESFLAYATGMPIGSLLPVAGSAIPSGFLLCDGQAVSRTTYPDLFTAIGTIYGSGDGTTTFNVPDMRDWFVRGKADSRPVGSTQAASFASHTHAFSDPGHAHTASQAAHDHSITTGGHNHSVNDPGHFHQATFYTHNDNGPLLGNANGGAAGTLTTDTRVTGVTLNAVGDLGGSADARQPAVTVNASVTGASIGVTGGDETRPQNIAMNYVIKAVNDSSSTVSLTGITSSDDNAISIDNTLPTVPNLVIHSNVAFGLVKLDGSGTIPLNLLPSGSQNLLGYWDASTGLLPTGTFSSGDSYIISVAGVLTVYDPVTLTASPTSVNVGDFIQYITGSITNPTGWYHVVPSTTVTAGQVQFTPVDNISATNVQAAITEVNGDVIANTGAIVALNNALTILDGETVKRTDATGAAILPSGTDGQRPASPVLGYQRANSEHGWMEWWNGSAWVQLGGMSQVAAEAAFLQVDGGNQMLAPLVFDTNANSVLKVGVTPVAQFPTTCGLPFMKNKLINGEVTRINQRGVANWAAVANGAYGYDRWKKIDASNMTQIIEAGNFRPNTVHTLSGIGVTTQQITSPASGNWTLPNIPIAATNVQVEEGLEATPFEVRHIGFELALCQRYYYRTSAEAIGMCVSTILALVIIPFPVPMRVAPTMGTSVLNGSLTNAAGSPVSVSSIASPTTTVNDGRFSAGVTSGLIGGNATMYTAGTLQWDAEIP